MSFVTTCSLIGQFTGLKISHFSFTLSASVCVCYSNVPTAETQELHVANDVIKQLFGIFFGKR